VFTQSLSLIERKERYRARFLLDDFLADNRANKNKGFGRIPCCTRICKIRLNRFTKSLLYL
jgi:hypothetical protein